MQMFLHQCLIHNLSKRNFRLLHFAGRVLRHSYGNGKEPTKHQFSQQQLKPGGLSWRL